MTRFDKYESCLYCNRPKENENTSVMWYCNVCKGFVHHHCLKTKLAEMPTKVQHDNYFDFKCVQCSFSNSEEFERKNLDILLIVYITTYNLGLSAEPENGHYVHQDSICEYIFENWKYFKVKPKKLIEPWPDKHKLREKIRETLVKEKSFFINGRGLLNKQGFWGVVDQTKSPCYNPFQTPFIFSSRRRKADEVNDPNKKKKIKNQYQNVWSKAKNSEFSSKKSMNYKVPKTAMELIHKSKITNYFKPILPTSYQSTTKESLVINQTSSKVVSESCDIESKKLIWISIISEKNMPVWLKLHKEIKQKKNGLKKHLVETNFDKKDFIKFMRISSKHLESLKILCDRYFWCGINIPEDNKYSVVAMYNNVIVGFGFLNTSETTSYLPFLFVRPYWRRTGIAKQMLYHLIKSNPSNKIGLHVSIYNNPALRLYESFNFVKIRLDLNYYSKDCSFKTNDAVYMELNM